MIDLSHLEPADAFKEALLLAIAAPTDEQAHRATLLAHAISRVYGLTEETVNQVMADIEEGI